MDAAFAARAVVKATLMRVALHVVDADDHAVLHAAMQPTLRAARLQDRRFSASGLTAAEVGDLVAQLLGFVVEPHTGTEIQAWLDGRLGVTTADAEARSLLALRADRDPRVYRRYDRWWTTLPGVDVRVLPA